MVQVELGDELEQRLLRAAADRHITVDEYMRQAIESDLPKEPEDQAERHRRHSEAIEGLRTFASRHKTTLGPDLTIRDLINEGRR